jgi:VWFA-related protein
MHRQFIHGGFFPVLLILLALAGAAAGVPQQNSSSKGRLPRPEELGRGYVLRRDPVTGELRRVPPKSAVPGAPDEAAAGPATIRSEVNLIEVTCNVLDPDGANVRGIIQKQFQVYEDNILQTIAHFDASSEPASIVLVLDASPSIYRELAQMKSAARALTEKLSAADEVAVVSFSAQAHLLLPFSSDRALLEKALDSQALARVENSAQSNIYQAVYQSAIELFRDRAGRKAIVLLTDGQDSGLGLTWDIGSANPKSGKDADRLVFDDVARVLAALGVQTYIVSTEPRPGVLTDQWLSEHARAPLVTEKARELGIPAYTAYLAELVRRAGGRLYFLREIGNLNEVYRRIAEALSSQYVIGYYSNAPQQKPGWHSLHIEVLHPDAFRVMYRPSYYLPAAR